MATTGLDFATQVDAWVAKTKQRMEAVWKESAQRVVSAAQSNVPVDTGYLRASIRGSMSAMPQINSEARPTQPKYAYDAADMTLTILNAKLGEVIYAGYTAAYSGFVEYGTSKMAPRAFVARAAQEWPRIVSEVTAEAKTRAGPV